MSRKVIVILVCILFCVCGCGRQETGNVLPATAKAAGMESEPVMEYTVPESIPGILINQAGYRTKGQKTAIFRGEQLPDTFRVRKAETKEIVYEGTTEVKGEDKVTGEQIAYGVFDGLTAKGEYYIEAEILGYSYPFSIDYDVYRDILCESIRGFSESPAAGETFDSERTKVSCETIINLLLAGEIHGTAFDDACGTDKSGNDISDLTDAVYVQVTALIAGKEEVLASKDQELLAYYAAALAKFSYAYKEYDNSAATACLQLADLAWKQLEQAEKKLAEEARFMAATELYRASGGYKYHTYIKEYGRTMQEGAQKSREEIYGEVTYIATKQTVDVELCSIFMKEIMGMAEEISARSKESYYQAETNKEQDNNGEILWNMVILTVVDYVISNHEYATVIENHLHYFLGRNSFAVSYIEDFGSRSFVQREGCEGIMDNGVLESAFLFILSEVCDGDE